MQNVVWKATELAATACDWGQQQSLKVKGASKTEVMILCLQASVLHLRYPAYIQRLRGSSVGTATELLVRRSGV